MSLYHRSIHMYQLNLIDIIMIWMQGFGHRVEHRSRLDVKLSLLQVNNRRLHHSRTCHNRHRHQHHRHRPFGNLEVLTHRRCLSAKIIDPFRSSRRNWHEKISIHKDRIGHKAHHHWIQDPEVCTILWIYSYESKSSTYIFGIPLRRRKADKSWTTCQRVLFESTTVILSSRRSFNKWRTYEHWTWSNPKRITLEHHLIQFICFPFLFAVHSHNEHIIERQNIENERQRKMADLANRRHDGAIPSDVTLRSVSLRHCHLLMVLLQHIKRITRQIPIFQSHLSVHKIHSKVTAQRTIKLNVEHVSN